MPGRLVVLRGTAPVTFFDPRGKSNFDAGLLFMQAFCRLYPGATWQDFFSMAGPRPKKMSGWWTDMKHAVGDVVDGIGGVISDTKSLIGGAGGDIVRLATDQQVLDGIARAGEAIATDGASEGARSASDALSGIFTPAQKQTLEAAGFSYKTAWGDNLLKNPVVWVLGGVTGLSLLAFMFKGRGK